MLGRQVKHGLVYVLWFSRKHMRHEWHTNYNTFVVIVPGRENCSENCTAAALIDGVGLLLRDTV